jgi:hypothetical protein
MRVPWVCKKYGKSAKAISGTADLFTCRANARRVRSNTKFKMARRDTDVAIKNKTKKGNTSS